MYKVEKHMKDPNTKISILYEMHALLIFIFFEEKNKDYFTH
jgi:hypothetical protein